MADKSGADLQSDEMKAAVRDGVNSGIKEWLDGKFAMFGKYSARALAALILVALLKFVIWTHGWNPIGLDQK